MLGTYIQRGETIDYMYAGPLPVLPAGTIVSLFNRIGVAGCDIPMGNVGTLHVVGVFEGNKAAVAFAVGDEVYYDPVADLFTNVAANNVPAGWAVEQADAQAQTVRIKLLG